MSETPFNKTARNADGMFGCAHLLLSVNHPIRRPRNRRGSGGSRSSVQSLPLGCVQRLPALQFLTFDRSDVAEGRPEENPNEIQGAQQPAIVWVRFRVQRYFP